MIVAITDYLGLQPWATFAAHGAAKAAEIHLVKELARAWAPAGVRVCGVAPGPVDLDDDEHRGRHAARRGARRARSGWWRPPTSAPPFASAWRPRGSTGVNIAVDNGSLVMS